jgi:hypothetical protein
MVSSFQYNKKMLLTLAGMQVKEVRIYLRVERVRRGTVFPFRFALLKTSSQKKMVI